MITNQVMGWEESLKNLQYILRGCTPLKIDCYSTGDNISILLHVIRKELEKTSDTAHFSKELLQVIANNYRGV